jgi:hypothetical protein
VPAHEAPEIAEKYAKVASSLAFGTKKVAVYVNKKKRVWWGRHGGVTRRSSPSQRKRVWYR